METNEWLLNEGGASTALNTTRALPRLPHCRVPAGWRSARPSEPSGAVFTSLNDAFGEVLSGKNQGNIWHWSVNWFQFQPNGMKRKL